MAITISMDVLAKAVSEYENHDFSGYAVLNGVAYATKEDGFYELGSMAGDAGEAIAATVTLPYSDYGTSFLKRIRTIYFGGRTLGSFVVQLFGDRNLVEEKTLVAESPDLEVESLRVRMGRISTKARYFSVTVKNTLGEFFRIDKISAIVVLIGRKPRL